MRLTLFNRRYEAIIAPHDIAIRASYAVNMASMDWSDGENDAIVADYFAMLADDEAGRPYNEAEHNRGLQQRIGRQRTSIEFKHQNISAVLKGLGESWIAGYKPAFNF